ncbi:MAG: helix-turn-helix transcriptional regulator [candidate division WOR-3 bacterium]|nr:MAG: helix-turn-helix transcriptional regulator [candidate division WOR-3 bacterium]
MMHISADTGMARLLAALGHEHRLRIVELLRQGERCVCEITPAFDLDPSVVSRHLAHLVRAGAIRSRRDGRRIFYQVADHRVLRLVDAVRSVVVAPDKARPVGPRARAAGARC